MIDSLSEPKFRCSSVNFEQSKSQNYKKYYINVFEKYVTLYKRLDCLFNKIHKNRPKGIANYFCSLVCVQKAEQIGNVSRKNV